MTLFTETVEVGTRVVVGRDDYGNDLVEFVWAKSPAWLEQTNSTANKDRQEQTTAIMRLYVPMTTAINHLSLVRYAGFEWELNGEPGRQPGGFAVEGYQIAMLVRTED